MAQYGGGNKCVRCSKTVYFNEQIGGPGGMYHKTCFTCKECSKKLDSTNLTENNNEAYCKTCYGKLFGPKGYGYGNTLSMESMTAKSSHGSAQDLSKPKPSSNTPSLSNVNKSNPNLQQKYAGTSNCPTCDKQVYFAEQTIGPGGLKYHKSCFKCVDCKKSLDSATIADKDLVIYCRPCHNKNFGTKGYGYGGAITL